MIIQNENQLPDKVEHIDTIVIGGGQAGLAAGYFLKNQKKSFIILDKNPHTGDSWRQRWDSLRLFTPSKANGLPAKAFPGDPEQFPTKNEAAVYLEEYAQSFQLPVLNNINVERLNKNGNGFRVATTKGIYSAGNVVIATGAYHTPFIPGFSSELDPSFRQIHSSAYRNPDGFPAETVLVVGAGNSGAEIAYELAGDGRKVWLSGRDVGRIPFHTPLGKAFGGRPMWWFLRNVMTVKTPIGRKMMARSLNHGGALGRLNRSEVAAAGVEMIPHISGVQSGKPVLESGKTLQVEGVIWATGFRPDFRWVDLPVFQANGFPRHSRGVVPEAPGLFFLGLPFQSGMSSTFNGRHWK